MTTYRYPIDLTPDESGRIIARAPDLIGCITDGADPADALVEMADALEVALSAAMQDQEDIPPPSATKGRPTVAPGAVLSAKLALYQACRTAGISHAALASRLGIRESEVQRMLDPSHTTKIGQLEAALIALGKRLTISVDDAA